MIIAVIKKVDPAKDCRLALEIYNLIRTVRAKAKLN
jgi:hypothetical protein